jgi:hypothetical protein
MNFQTPTLTEHEVGTLEACVEFLRSRQYGTKDINTAYGIAAKLEAIVKRAYPASMIKPDKSPSERAVE